MRNRQPLAIILILSLLSIVLRQATAAPLSRYEYSCLLATYGDYVLSTDSAKYNTIFGQIMDVNYTKPLAVSLKGASFERVPCGDPVFSSLYKRTNSAQLGQLNVGNTPYSTRGAYNGQYNGYPFVMGWAAVIVAPGDDLSLCIAKNNSTGINYVSCSKGSTQANGVSVAVEAVGGVGSSLFRDMLASKSVDFTLSGSTGRNNEDYGCKSNAVGGVFLEASCDWPIATHMYSLSSPNTCRQIISPLPVYASRGTSGNYSDFYTTIEYANSISCPTAPGLMYSCTNDSGQNINCLDSARLAWDEGRKITFKVVEASASQMCPSNDPNCLSPGINSRVIPYAPEGAMAMHSKTYRPNAIDPINATNAADAVLAQTSYMARVMIQANDIFPPSHISTRSSGEIYASTVSPIDYNLKALTQVSIYRNSLGATVTSVQNANPTTAAANTVNTVARDWVEFHLNQYCDPLAGSIGKNGLNNCNSALNSLKKNEITEGMTQGKTSWDLVTTKGQRGPYAADITANILFSAKAQDPEATMRYIYNLTNIAPTPLTLNATDFSVPNDYLTVYNGTTTLKDAGYNIYMSYLEEQSKLSLSQYALMQIFSERMQLDTIKVPVTKWDKDGKKIESFEFTSRHGLLEFESTKRFKDPAWYDRVQQMPVPALLKELAYIQSTQLALEFKRYEQDQLQTAMMASLTSDIAKMTKYMKQMQQQASDPSGTQAQIMNQLNSITSQFEITPPP